MPKRVAKVPKATEEPTTPAEINAAEGAEAPATPSEVAADLGEDPDYLKVVIILREGRGSIGVQRAGCDPFLLPLPDAGLANAIARLPDALVEAGARWREQRQYPKYTRPAPPPRPAAPPVTRARTAPGGTARVAPSTEPAVERPRMF